LLRDAAHQLQLPGDRARLHRPAFAAIEGLCGGRAADSERSLKTALDRRTSREERVERLRSAGAENEAERQRRAAEEATRVARAKAGAPSIEEDPHPPANGPTIGA
jgi:hypothetical protein